MRVLNVHNYHIGHGGMEVLHESLTRLLRARGHAVQELVRHNEAIDTPLKKLVAVGSGVYSPSAKRDTAEAIRTFRPDVAHLFNLYPQLSVSVIDACHCAGVPVVLHVQDYKLTCPTAQHLRDGQPCHACLGGREYNAARYNCRGSRAMSTAYAVRNAAVRLSRRVHERVSRFITPTRFVRDLTVNAGYPADRMEVIPNFFDLPDADACTPPTAQGGYVAYVGRISPEKGLDVLLEAARISGLPVKIAGDPSAMPQLAAQASPSVQFVGKLGRGEVGPFLNGARFLVVPSVWYEAFGIVAAEAMARLRPVIASDIGGLPEVVQHERTGLLVPPNDAAALAAAMCRLWDDTPLNHRLAEAARIDAQARFTTDAFYERLIPAYRRAAELVADRTTPPGRAVVTS
ncbi:MAG: glycosyltransferase [Phycisphaerae bacterium]